MSRTFRADMADKDTEMATTGIPPVDIVTPDQLDMPLDEGIADFVHALRAGGVETFESCEGGPSHPFPEPTIRFFGADAAGWYAIGVAKDHGLPVSALRRVWRMQEGEPTGPDWEMTFYRKAAAEQQ